METKVNNNYYAIAHKIVAICLYCRFISMYFQLMRRLPPRSLFLCINGR